MRRRLAQGVGQAKSACAGRTARLGGTRARMFEWPAYGQRAVRGHEFAPAPSLDGRPGSPGGSTGPLSAEPVPPPVAAAAQETDRGAPAN